MNGPGVAHQRHRSNWMTQLPHAAATQKRVILFLAANPRDTAARRSCDVIPKRSSVGKLVVAR